VKPRDSRFKVSATCVLYRHLAVVLASWQLQQCVACGASEGAKRHSDPECTCLHFRFSIFPGIKKIWFTPVS
jgi:hypothetical protein